MAMDRRYEDGRLFQNWTALSVMLLVKPLQRRVKLSWALSNLVALLCWNLFTYRDLWQRLDAPFGTPIGSEVAEQTRFLLDRIQPLRTATAT